MRQPQRGYLATAKQNITLLDPHPPQGPVGINSNCLFEFPGELLNRADA